MSQKTNIRQQGREARKIRVRRKVQGTESKPRLCVYRSLRFTYAQLIADDSGRVLGAASSRDLEPGEKSLSSVDSAKQVGKRIAEIAREQKIETAVFDRNGYRYHGRVSAVADGAREAGLKF